MARNEMHLVVMIQSVMRSYLASKQVNRIKYGSYMTKDFNARVEGDYKNERVEEMVMKLGDFEFSNDHDALYDDAPRERRAFRTLENGAKYSGEWNIKNGTRHGQGT